MSYTHADLLLQLRQLLNEPVEDFWTEVELSQWLQNGAIDVSTKGRCVELSINITLVPYIPAYVLPPEVIGIERVLRRSDGTALANLRLRQFGNVSAGNDTRPTSYAHYANQVVLFPLPQVIETITVACWATTGEVTLLPMGYQPLVVLYALKMARMKEQRYAEAMQLNSMYLAELQFQRSDLQEREPDTKETLRFADRMAR